MDRVSPERSIVRWSGLANSMRIFSSFFCSHICPASVEVSFTTSVYLMCSTFADRVRKSRAPASIRLRTDSVVHFSPAWALAGCGPARAIAASTPSNCAVLPVRVRLMVNELGRFALKIIVAQSVGRTARAPSYRSRVRGNSLFSLQRDLIGNYRTLLIPQGLKIDDLKAPVLQAALGSL